MRLPAFKIFDLHILQKGGLVPEAQGTLRRWDSLAQLAHTQYRQICRRVNLWKRDFGHNSCRTQRPEGES